MFSQNTNKMHTPFTKKPHIIELSNKILIIFIIFPFDFSRIFSILFDALSTWKKSVRHLIL